MSAMQWERRRIAATAAVPALLAALALGAAAPAAAADRPRYDVPAGYTRCPDATAWNGFFKWASVRGARCARAAGVIRSYADAALDGPMPRHHAGFACRVRFWRNDDGDVYASRHTCRNGDVVVRFYGMV